MCENGKPHGLSRSLKDDVLVHINLYNQGDIVEEMFFYGVDPLNELKDHRGMWSWIDKNLDYHIWQSIY